MTALNDAERVAVAARTAPRDRDPPVPTQSLDPQLQLFYPAWLPSYRFIAAVSPSAAAGYWRPWTAPSRSWRCRRSGRASPLSDTGPQLGHHGLRRAHLQRPDAAFGGRLGDTIGRKRTFIVGVALFTIALRALRRRLGQRQPGHRPAAAGRRATIASQNRPGAGGHHLPQGPGPQRGDRPCSPP